MRAAAAIAFSILVALGMWQLHRRAWKAHILAQVDAAERAPPVPLGVAPPGPFAKVVAAGTLGPEQARYGAEVRETMGAQALTILHRDNAPPVLVDLGWLPDGTAIPGGPARIIGYARPPDRAGWLAAADDPAAHRFFTLDPAAIGVALGMPRLAPFTLVALAPGLPGGPAAADALPRPPDNHLQYAFTWFGLAGALVWVVVGYERRQRA